MPPDPVPRETRNPHQGAIMSIHLTHEEVVAELERVIGASPNPTGAFTTRDLATMLGITEDQVRKKLKSVRAQNRLEVCRITRPNLGGIPQSRIAYRILTTDKK